MVTALSDVTSTGTSNLDAGKSITFTLDSSEAVNAVGSALTLSNGATAAYTSGSGSETLTFTYTVGSGDASTADLKVTGYSGTIADSAGNALVAAGVTEDTGVAITTSAPVVTALSDVTSTGTSNLDAGKSITFTLDSSEAVNAVGSALTLSNGATAAYTSGSGSETLTFTYTVGSGDASTADLKVTGYSGTIADSAGNALVAAGVTEDTGVAITTSAPVVTALSDVTSTGTSNLDAGKSITFTLDSSEAVNAVGSALTLSNGATAAYTSGSGSETLTFTYTVGSGDASTADLKVTGYSGTIADSAGNALVAAGVTEDTGVAITTSAPVVTALSDVTSTGTSNLDAGKSITFTLDSSEAVNAVGSALTLSNGATAAYTSGSGSETLTFTYTVGSGDASTADLKVTGYSGTIADSAGNALVAAGVTEDTGVAITTSAPVVTALSDVTSTGTSNLDAGKSITFTLDSSEAVNAVGSALTLSNGATAAYTSGSGSETLTFTYTVGSGDASTADLKVTGYSGTIADSAGNALVAAGVTEDTGVAITTSAPVVTALSDVTSTGTSNLDAGKSITFTLDSSEAVNAVGSALTLSNGATAAYTSGSGSETLTFTYTVGSGDASTADLKVTGYSGTIADSAGNALVAAGVTEDTGVAITTSAPVVTALSDVTSTGTSNLDAGKSITFTLDSSEAVNAVGSALTLSNGATAAYTSGSGSETLTFTYTVGSGDASTADLKVTGYSGTIADSAGNALVAAGVTEDTGVAITTSAPVVTALSDVTSTGTSNLDAGKSITFTLDSSEAVNAVGSALTLSNGATAAYTSGSGSETLTFTYTVGSGDASTADLKVTGYSGTIADSAGNALVAAGVTEDTGVAITTSAPVVTALSDVTSTGTSNLDAGKSITFTLDSSEAVNAVGSALTLSNGATAAYTSGSGSETLTFTYTVGSGDASTADLKVTGYSGTIADSAGNALVAAGVTEDTGVAITTSAPVVTALSDVTSTGTSNLDAGKSITFTLDSSEAVNAVGSALTLSNGATAAYTSGSGSETLTFTYTVGSGDASTADLKVTGYSGTIADSAGNALVAAGVTEDTGVAITTSAPVVTALSDVTSTGTSNLDAGKSITFTLDSSEAVNAVGSALTLSNGATAAYTSGSGSETLTFTYTVGSGDASTADLKVTGYSGTIADSAGNALVAAGVTEDTGVAITTSAQTDEWLNTNGGTWTDTANAGTNWSDGAQPRSVDSALIDLSGSGAYIVTIPNGTSATAAALTLNSGNATLSDQGALTLNGELTIDAGTFQLSVSGTLIGETAITNAGTFEIAGADTLTTFITNTNGTVQVDAGDTLTLAGGSISGGAINLAAATDAVSSISEISVPGLDSIAPAMSGNGQFIAFMTATDLPEQHGGLNAAAVELYDSANGQLTDLSALVPTADLHPGEQFSSIPSVSENGQYVVFEGQYVVPNGNFGDQPNSGPNSNSLSDIFLYNTQSNDVALVYSGASDNGSTLASISSDGQLIATELTTTTTNQPFQDYIVVTNDSGVVQTQITGNPNFNFQSGNTFGDGASVEDPAISGNGDLISFWSTSSEIVVTQGSSTYTFNNLNPGQTNAQVYVYNTVSHSLQMVSVNNQGQQGNGDSGALSLSGNDNSDWPSPISANGTYVVFQSSATNLVPGSGSGTQNGVPSVVNSGASNVYLYDTQTDTITLVSAGLDGAAANGASYIPEISADGNYVSFESTATNLVAGGSAGQAQTYIYDIQTGTVQLASMAADGIPADNESDGLSAISSNGSVVAFGSLADNLVVPDANDGNTNVFVTLNQAGAASTPAGTLDVTANATIEGGASLKGGAVAVASGVTLTLDSATFSDTTLSISNSATLQIEDGGTSFQGVTVNNSGVIDVIGAATLSVDSDSVIVNAGTLKATAGGELAIDGNISNFGGAIAASGNDSVVQLSGATITEGSMSIGATDTLAIESGSASSLNDVNLENAGDVQVDAELQATTLILTDGTIMTGGTLSIGAVGEVEILSGADDSGATLENVDVSNAGTLAITNSATLTLAGTIDGGTITNNGLIDITGASTIDDGAVLTGGEIAIQNGQALTLNGATVESSAIAATATYSFIGVADPSAVTSDYALAGQGLEINNAGEVVGNYGDANGNFYGFTDSGGSYTTVNDPLVIQNGSSQSGTTVTGINNSGTLVGYYQDSSGGFSGFVDNNGNFTTFNDSAAPESTFGLGISNSGEIVGVVYVGNNETEGFIDNAGTYTNLQDPNASVSNGGTYSFAINTSGQVLGDYYDTNDDVHAFIYNGTYTDISDPAAAESASGGGLSGTHATAINSSGQVVGYYVDANGVPNGFLYSGGTYTTLDDPAGVNGTVAEGINDAGEVVGYYFDGNGNTQVFTYSNGVYTDVNDPSIAEGGGIQDLAINNAGQIVGTYNNGELQGFLADPGQTTVGALDIDGNTTILDTSLSGVTLTVASGVTLTLDDVIASGVTINADAGASIEVDAGETLTWAGTDTINASAFVFDNSGHIVYTGSLTNDFTTVTFEGSGTVTRDGGSAPSTAAHITLTNEGNTFDGYGTQGNGAGELIFINEAAGTVDADFSGETYAFDPGDSTTNSGTFEATNGGLLLIESTVANDTTVIANTGNGNVQAEANSEVELSSAVIDFGMVSTAATGVIVGSGASEIENAIIDNLGKLGTSGGTLTLTTGDTVTNTGTFEVNGGTLDIVDTVTGSGGSASIHGGTFQLGSTDAQALTFNNNDAGTLALGDAAGFTGAISGLVVGDAIDLTNIAPSSITSTSINDGTLTVNVQGSATPLTYQVAGALTGNYFVVQNDSGSGSDLVLSPDVLAISVATTDSNLGVQVGQTLVAQATLDAGDAGATVAYQWQISSNSGATWTDVPATTTGDYSNGTLASFYQLPEADEGDLVRAQASFTNSSGQLITATSASTGPITDVTPEITLPFSYAVDDLSIDKANASGTLVQIYNDTFGQAPPVSPDVSGSSGPTPVEFSTQGSVWTEGTNNAGHAAAILSSTGVAPGGFNNSNADVVAFLNTNIAPQGTGTGDSNSGLKENVAFEVAATFDLPTGTVRGNIGLQLNDGTSTQNPDQVVSLVLTGGNNGTSVVELEQQNLATGSTSILASQTLTVPQGDDEIEFQLAHLVPNSQTIAGSFELFDNGVADPTTATSFTPTGTIFTNGVTWTRADIFAGITPGVGLNIGAGVSPHAGQTLTASATTNDPNATAINYQWEELTSASFTTFSDIGTDIASYTVKGSDVGDFIRVVATTNDSSNPTTAMSAVTGTVLPTATAPTITGTLGGQTTTSEAPVTPFSGVTIGDANNNGTDTDTLTITYAAGDGTLTDGAGFHGTSSLSGASGDYTLTGTAAAITAELDALSFTPVDGVPSTAVTTTFTLSDLSSVYGTATVDSTTTVTDSDPPSGSVTDTWTAGVSGDWTDGGDWSAGSSPSAGDQAAIGTGGNPQFNSNGSLDDIALQNAGTLGVASGATLLLDDGTTMYGGTLSAGN